MPWTRVLITLDWRAAAAAAAAAGFAAGKALKLSTPLPVPPPTHFASLSQAGQEGRGDEVQ
eukprot:179117-Pelagomonas_calceolata.AAC.4